jgi:hypothetical protein
MLNRVLRTPVGKAGSRSRQNAYGPQALRASLAAFSPAATHSTLLPRISQSLLQTRLLSQEVRTAIDRAVASAPVVLFMKGTPETPQCGFSRTSIQILGMQGVDPSKFTAFNVLEDEDLRSGTPALLPFEKSGLSKTQASKSIRTGLPFPSCTSTISSSAAATSSCRCTKMVASRTCLQRRRSSSKRTMKVKLPKWLAQPRTKVQAADLRTLKVRVLEEPSLARQPAPTSVQVCKIIVSLAQHCYGSYDTLHSGTTKSNA